MQQLHNRLVNQWSWYKSWHKGVMHEITHWGMVLLAALTFVQVVTTVA